MNDARFPPNTGAAGERERVGPVVQPTWIAVLLIAIHIPAQLVSHATEQAVVVPADGVGARAPLSLFWLACGFPNPRIDQILFRVPDEIPSVVRSMAFRRLDDPRTPPTYPAFTVDLEIGMAHSPRTTEIPSYDLAANRGSDFTLVVPRRTIQFPATPPRAGSHPFEYRIPLAQPFSFRRGAVGLIEMRIHATSACARNDLPFEYYALDRVGATSFGAPCHSVTMFPPTALVAGNFSSTLQTPPLGSDPRAHAHGFGGLRNDSWAGLQLPYSLAALGAPGCSLYISFDWEWPSFWPSNAATMYDLTLPNDPSIVGKMVYLQGVRFDLALNPLGFATTQGWQAVVNPYSLCPVSVVKGPFLQGGQVRVGYGPVFLLSDR
jgi:hypothetical protein